MYYAALIYPHGLPQVSTGCSYKCRNPCNSRMNMNTVTVILAFLSAQHVKVTAKPIDRPYSSLNPTVVDWQRSDQKSAVDTHTVARDASVYVRVSEEELLTVVPEHLFNQACPSRISHSELRSFMELTFTLLDAQEVFVYMYICIRTSESVSIFYRELSNPMFRMNPS